MRIPSVPGGDVEVVLTSVHVVKMVVESGISSQRDKSLLHAGSEVHVK